jgi:hypothetical protein
MTSQWDKLCAILERAEKMPAKQKAAYLQSALMALALEAHTKLSVRDLKSVTTRMRAKANGQKARKKRRAVP